jgi:O-antigen ligase
MIFTVADVTIKVYKLPSLNMMMALKSSSSSLQLYKPFQWVCWCWWAVLPFSIGLANVFLGVASLLGIWIFIRSKQAFSPVLLLPGSLLFLIGASTIIWSDDLSQGFKEIKTHLPLFLSSLVIYIGIKHQPDIIQKGLLIFSVSCLLAFGFTAAFNLLPYEDSVRLHAFFGDLLQPYKESNKGLFGWYVPFMVRTQFGNMLSLLGMACLISGVYLKRNYYILLGILFWLMVFILGLRGSVLGIVGAALMLVVFLFHYNLSFSLRGIWWLALIVIVLPAAYWAYENGKARWSQTKFEWETIHNGDYLSYEYQHFTLLTRLVSWKNGLELWQDHPLFGTGIGDYKKAFADTYKNDPVDIPLYYHSQWLYFLGVFGAAGLFVFLFLYGKWILTFSKTIYSYTYIVSLTVFFFIIWIFDAGMLSQTDMMSFGIFTSLAEWFRKDNI